jgi:hypothetical protein
MRWTQETLGSVRGYVYAGVGILVILVYLVTR